MRTDLEVPKSTMWSRRVQPARRRGFARRARVVALLVTAALAMSAQPITAAPKKARLSSMSATGWHPAGSVGARVEHTATLLSDGKVFVTGGRSSGSPVILDTTTSYDPATNAWTAKTAMGTPRLEHSATLLANGKVLVAGGNGGTTNTAELYDPAANTWSSTGSMVTGRSRHTATRLSNGKVLVAGGIDPTGGILGLGGATDAVELYDPASGTWSAHDPMLRARDFHTATVLGDGRVLVVSSNVAEVYDPTATFPTPKWTPTGPLAVSRTWHAATRLNGGKVLVAGGSFALEATGYHRSVEIYDPTTNAWVAALPMNEGRQGLSATTLADGKVLVAGGDSGEGISFDSAELYDPASPTSTWTTIASTLDDQRTRHTATRLSDGDVLVTGGNGDGGSRVSTAERYTP